MAFKRKIQSEPTILEHFKGGEGCVQKWDILKADEMYGKGRVCSLMALAPGHEVGRHRHEGDGEEHYMVNTGDELLEYFALVLFSK